MFLIDICQRKYSANAIGAAGSWTNGLDIQATNVSSRTAQTPVTQLAVARTGWRNDNISIRLFYQSVNNTLRQTMFTSGRGIWEDSLIESEDGNFEASPGGGLAATSSGGIRLFYQNPHGDIKAIKESGNEWIDRKVLSFNIKDPHGPFTLIVKNRRTGKLHPWPEHRNQCCFLDKSWFPRSNTTLFYQ